MQDLNTVSLTGRLTRDAVVATISTGTEVANFSIAVNRSKKDGDQWVDEVSFFDVVRFNPGGLAKYLVKGKRVGISGELQQDRWTDKEGGNRSKVKIFCTRIVLLDGGKGSSGDAPAPSESYGEATFQDDVPF
jgi:single-strand DNA-binding protein